jgi:hypothetical protein
MRSARSADAGSGGLNVIYETHKNAMYTGFGLIFVLLHPRRDPAPG